MPAFHRIVVPVVWSAFMAVSAWALWEVGYVGVLEAALTSGPGGIQVFCDLLVACGFATVWMIQDARARGTNPWPWALAVLALGSIPIATYALLRPWLGAPDPAAHSSGPPGWTAGAR